MSKQKGTLRERPAKRSLPGKNYLFTVAIDCYNNGIAELANCCKDADDFSKLLLEKYQFEPNEHTKLRNEACTRSAIIQELENHLAVLAPNDNLIFFISGHGEVINNSAYYLPQDARKGSTAEYLSFLDLTNRLAAIKCKHFILIYDGCHAGAIFKTTKSLGYPVTAVDYPSRFGISSSHGRELSDDGTAGENSPFVEALLGELSRNNRPLKVNVLADRVQDHLGTLSKDQTSVSGKLTIPGDKNGQFVFTPKKEYYQLATALDFLKRGEEKNAIQELIMLFRTAEKLPLGYEFYTVIPSFWLNRLADFEERRTVHTEDIAQLRQNIARKCLVEISSLQQKIAIKDVEFLRVLNALAKGRMVYAQGRLFMKFEKDFNRLYALFRIGYLGEKLQKDFSSGITVFDEFIVQANQLLLELLNLIFGADRFKGEIYDPLKTCKELIAIDHNKYALSEMRAQYAQMPDRGNGIFFLPVVTQRNERLLEQVFIQSQTDQNLRIEENRVRWATLYLMSDLKRIQDSLDPTDETVFPRPLMPFSQMQLDEEFSELVANESIDTSYLTRVFLDQIVAYAKRCELEKMLKYIAFDLGDEAFVESFEERKSSFRDNMIRGLVSVERKYAFWHSMLRYLKHFIDAMRSAQRTVPTLAQEETELRAFYELDKPETQLEYLRQLLIQNKIQAFFTCLLSFEPANVLLELIGFLRNMADVIEEDELFTDKPTQLINQRKEELIIKLLDLLVQVEQGLPELKTAKHPGEAASDDPAVYREVFEDAQTFIANGNILASLKLLDKLALNNASKTELVSIFNAFTNYRKMEIIGTKSSEQNFNFLNNLSYRILSLISLELKALK